MTMPGPTHYQAALEAACDIAGLDVRDATLLHIRGNAVYHLPRSQVIARLRAAPGAVSTVMEQFTAAVDVTTWLRRQGFPATEPLDLDQPIAVDGHVATFWCYVTVINDTERDLATLGRLIGRLHSLPTPEVSLPSANPLGSLRDDLDNSDAISHAERRWLLGRADDLEEQYRHATWTLGTGLIHGDAHAGNLLHALDGVMLGDWDSVSHGPRELDLVPTSMWYRYGRPRIEWDTFCAAYGVNPDDLPGVPLLQKLRELQALGAYARNATDHAFRNELARRITSLKTGNRFLPWHAL
jgi:aminoglycoside phosphotransferase (APT) family kinase protein